MTNPRVTQVSAVFKGKNPHSPLCLSNLIRHSLQTSAFSAPVLLRLHATSTSDARDVRGLIKVMRLMTPMLKPFPSLGDNGSEDLRLQISIKQAMHNGSFRQDSVPLSSWSLGSSGDERYKLTPAAATVHRRHDSPHRTLSLTLRIDWWMMWTCGTSCRPEPDRDWEHLSGTWASCLAS